MLTPEIFFNNGREIAYLQIVTEIMSSTGGVSFKPKMNPQTSVTVYTSILKLLQNIAPLIVTCAYSNMYLYYELGTKTLEIDSTAFSLILLKFKYLFWP